MTATGRPAAVPHEATPGPAVDGLTALQRGIILTVLYSDLFDYPLTNEQLHRYLVVACPARGEFERALAGLVGDHLTRTGPFVTLAGREHLVEIRQRRQAAVERGWEQAARYARWLAHVPFVRMVAVCGSQAAGNATPEADIDFFLISERGRLWTVQVCSMVLKRVASLRSLRVCPNYLLAADALEVSPRDLYSAREATQTVPLWGADAYARFLEANRWIEQFLPNAQPAAVPTLRLDVAGPPRLTRLAERLLGGRLGDTLDRTIHGGLMLYYPLRLRHLGWRSRHVRQAYRRDRQVVIHGGYGPAVAEAYRARVTAYFGEPVASGELARLFPGSTGSMEANAPDRLYSRLFAERYGHGHD